MEQGIAKREHGKSEEFNPLLKMHRHPKLQIQHAPGKTFIT